MYMNEIKHICPNCNKIFFNKDKRYKYCGHKCAADANIANKNVKFGFGKNGYTQGKMELNPAWKGERVSKRALHNWVERNWGRPRICEMCKTETANTYDWSNITGKYLRERSDWQYLCRSCHTKYDYDNGFRAKPYSICKPK